MSIVLPRQSLEVVSFPLSTSPVDPDTLDHEISVAAYDTQPSDWVSAAFSEGKVRVLVRASDEAAAGGDVTLAVGVWRLWWRAASNPEFPVRQVGVLRVV